MDGDRRSARSLQGLFKFCVEATKSEDAKGSSEFSAMSDEDKKFISDALAAAMGKDPVKVMMEDLEILTSEGNKYTNEEREQAIENLQMHCEDLDLAQDFYKIGGFAVLEKFLTDKDPELRWRAAELVATLVQNNPYCQDAALKCGLMQVLLQRLDKDEVDMVRVKALLAISGLTRTYEPSYNILLAEDGLSILTRALQSKNEKLETKVSFLMSYLFETAPRFKELFCEVGIVEQLVGLLHEEHKLHHEHFLRALAKLAEDNPLAVRECRRTEFSLEQLLREKTKQLAGKEEYKDALEYCEEILNTCFTENTTDR